jgi:DNA-binding beta-propeller fold protein YncE
VDVSGAAPAVRWIGCVAMPDGVSPNSVTPTPEGGFLVTKFMQAGDADGFAKMARLEKTGVLYEWRPKTGFKTYAGTEMSGNNGIALSADGQKIFMTAWSEKKVVRLDRASGKIEKSVAVDFLPDNLTWAPDGQLFAAGQRSEVLALRDCMQARNCTADWSVIKIDPATLQVTPVLAETGTPAFHNATGAVQMGRTLWIGTFDGDRLAYAVLE